MTVSVVGLERALEQYVTGADFDKPFDLKVVPISTLPLTVTEVKKPSLSVETVPERKEEKASRQDIYAEQLAAIPAFTNLGPLFRSSQPVALTDEITEYSVSCVKHIFPQHVVMQFDCKNTLNDQLLENVHVELEPTPDTVGWDVVLTLPLEKLPFGVQSTTYILLRTPDDFHATGLFGATLKFQVRDVDPATGEFESDESYDDAFALEEIEVTVADNVQPVQRSNFAASWEQMASKVQVDETYALSAVHSLQALQVKISYRTFCDEPTDSFLTQRPLTGSWQAASEQELCSI
ncbi:unnamed protein product [Gongylonema pulchrum]|uniref:COP-gamma_platf domain-containing protein n=1 Tax=Gongylonema pulchrum TaxID=637853 RepID=A0A183DUF1_9BILA|nr:unnamed protein product [Gongylonema pulchrum]